MKRALIFNCKFSERAFYFLPSILYASGECGCWSLSFILGNISIGVFTTCDPQWLDKI